MASTTVSAEANGNGMQKASALGWVSQAREYVTELQAEMKRVTWPTWHQVRATTGVVLACVFGFALYFWAVDIAFGAAVKRLIDTFGGR